MSVERNEGLQVQVRGFAEQIRIAGGNKMFPPHELIFQEAFVNAGTAVARGIGNVLMPFPKNNQPQK